MKIIIQNILIWLVCMAIIYGVASFISWDLQIVIQTEQNRALFITIGSIVSGFVTWIVRNCYLD